jgi:hypothetical protein
MGLLRRNGMVRWPCMHAMIAPRMKGLETHESAVPILVNARLLGCIVM